MKTIAGWLVWTVVLFCLSWFYANLLAVNLILLAPIYWFYRGKVSSAFGIAFWGGFVFDLVNINGLGLSSLVLLAAMFGFLVLQSRVEPGNIVVFTVYLIVVEWLWQLIVSGGATWGGSVALGAVFVIMFLLVFKKLFNLNKNPEIYLS